ncbi:hypothetical protein XaC1_202 [Xanthomonas phage XaC1]|nr:hypothetical protein XaC1_202 [Xanthomonas phage XaC1]
MIFLAETDFQKEKLIRNEYGYSVVYDNDFIKISSTRGLITVENNVNHDHTRVFRNEIITGIKPDMYITSWETNIREFDDDVYFNLSLLGEIPTKEHIDFALKLHNYGYIHDKTFIVYPKFINIETLRNTKYE